VNNIPILEFDPDKNAIIEPQKYLQKIDIADHCVLCFFQDVVNELKEAGKLRLMYTLKSEMGPRPVYEMDVDGQRLALCHPGVGAPLAAGFLEELIALGCTKFVACGGCGVLDSEIAVGHVIVPNTAVRDEGTSYHYLPPSREVSASETAVAAIQATLTQHHIPYRVGKTWTTDGLYRETQTKMARRKAEGCLVVEMEAAAFFAVAQFRDVTFGQLLYGGDDLTGDEWDHRDWHEQFSTRDRLFWLAAEAVLTL
jgi:uridine phosphorylase